MLQGKHWALLNCPERGFLMCQAYLDPASTGDKKVLASSTFTEEERLVLFTFSHFLPPFFPCQQQWGRMSVHQLPSLEFAFTPNSGLHSHITRCWGANTVWKLTLTVLSISYHNLLQQHIHFCQAPNIGHLKDPWAYKPQRC